MSSATVSAPTLVPHFVRGRDVCERAYAFALQAHEGMVRKAGAEPFINHPVRVAAKCWREGMNDAVIAAALLHDVVEDTPVGIEEIAERFGGEVARLVAAVTEDKLIPTYEARKHEHVQRLRRGGEQVGVLFCADKLVNLIDMLTAYEVEGEQLADRFNGTLDAKLEHTDDHVELLRAIPGVPERPILAEFERTLGRFLLLRDDTP